VQVSPQLHAASPQVAVQHGSTPQSCGQVHFDSPQAESQTLLPQTALQHGSKPQSVGHVHAVSPQATSQLESPQNALQQNAGQS
jgi:hypothetical protein